MNPEDQSSSGMTFQEMLAEKLDIADADIFGDDTFAPESVTVEADELISLETSVEEDTEIIIDDLDLFQAFIEESRDHLRNIENKTLSLEASGDRQMVDDIFRSMHTIKGNSAFFGFNKIKSLSHALESVLDEVRKDQLEAGPEMADLLLNGTDLLKQMVQELADAVSGNPKPPVKLQNSTLDVVPVINEITQISRQSKKTETEVGKGLGSDDLVTEDMLIQFVLESRDSIDEAEQAALDLEKNPANKDSLEQIFRIIHTIKGNAGFMGSTQVEEFCINLEAVLESLRSGERTISSGIIATMLRTFDSLRHVLGRLLSQDQNEAESPTQPEIEAEAEEEVPKQLGDILVEMGAITAEEIEKASDLQEKRIGEILLAQGKVSEDALQTALTKQQETMDKAPAAQSRRSAEKQDVRVDTEKLDKLFDLMGEIITAEAMVIHNPELAGLELENFNKSSAYLSKITREMQEITMTLRMIPLEGMFNKMRRLVRDLAKRFGKTINLKVTGQDTEMDRSVIEEISDPMVHIIRNAIDHGIEDEKARIADGKPGAGNISLSAKYEGNEIWITVHDDGAGLNRKLILNKAKTKDLLKTDPDSMTDEEVWQLVFEPGFSTAETVSDISGRGVGMDVVRQNIEKLRGKIDIVSVTGKSSDIIMKIPLTVAILDGITVRVGNALYAFPIGDILEFYKPMARNISKTDSRREVIKLREEILPIIKLNDFFGLASGARTIKDGIVLITQANGRKAGLLVDEILGNYQIVVKALPDYLGATKIVSGCSILGNGEVALIIDVAVLLKEVLE
jgi:two-component system, chemotaxis family, sensor kinase CheA